jgi:Tol biopolymer transport system component
MLNNFKIRPNLVVAVLVSTVLISSCGGDGDASPNTASTSPPSAAAAPTSDPAPTTSDPNPTTSDLGSWLAYQTVASGGGDEIHLVRFDGSDDHAIAGDAADSQVLPDWSPDGSRIVFAVRGPDGPVWEYDLATDTASPLPFDCTAPCIGDDEPTYSPDGQSVAFSRAFEPFVTDPAYGGAEVPSDCGIWIGTVATGEMRQLTSNTAPACEREYGPRWSPDGERLAYWRDPYAGGSPSGTFVAVLDVATGKEIMLTDPVDNFASPDWSPDGQWLVVDTYPLLEYDAPPEGSNLYRMRPDGSELEQLTDFPADERATQPRYTHDGESIVFTHVTPAGREIWVIPAAGGESRPLHSSTQRVRTHPDLQP